MKRSSIKRGTKRLQRHTPLRKMSAKRARLLKLRRAVRAEVLERDGFTCQAREVLPDIACEGRLDVHELVRRSQWSEGWLYAPNCKTVCRAHHEFVTARPEVGHAVGLVIWSWERRVVDEHNRLGPIVMTPERIAAVDELWETESREGAA
ncbi:MAG TPA: hypothetical protein VGK49_02875 [Ilumatobacteraceae bacterium]